MNSFRLTIAVSLILQITLALNARGADSARWQWSMASPESQGMRASDLGRVWTDLEARRTSAFLVIRNDTIVFERYGADQSRTTKHFTASMAKAVVGGISFAVAITDGLMELDDRAAKYIPQWQADAARSRITIRHLGSHTSGLEDAEDGGLPHGKLTGWKGDFWKRLPPPNDPFDLSRDTAPVLFPPGTRFQYSNPGLAMLGYAITAALKQSKGKDLRTLLRDRVMRPIGAPDNEWSVGYGQTFDVDGLPLVATWGGGDFSPNAVARAARLMLRRGDWEGNRVLSAAAVESVTVDAGTPGHGAMGWWSNNDGFCPNLPKDAFWGPGAGVVPSLNLIAVRFGEVLDSAISFDDALRNHFFEPLMDAVGRGAKARTETAPYPPSPVIKEVVWSPTIIRRAKSSDNWPLTWADDDNLYTAYGDGNGFEPFVPQKLSLGLAKISGSPAQFFGVNLRSPSLEQKGDGRAGKKGSGILAVGRILYLWVRNAANSQLAWSGDHGATWTWCDWRFTNSLGCPTFLNFGRGYSGARDRFVYVYSPDVDSAYAPADRFVLARVAKDQIRRREAYEFFRHIDAAGNPAWSRNIEARGAVFRHAGHCYRSGVTYDAALKRYLWCQTLPEGDARFSGGFGIFDAPEPWGPWTTVFYTREWDVGPGESSSLPTKWMSADGQTVYLVFSGDDSFSVRRANLRLAKAGVSSSP